MLTRRIRAVAAAILLASGLAAWLAGPAAASPAETGTPAAVTAHRSPDASGSSYTGQLTYDHQYWCLGATPNNKTGLPGPNSGVWWVPCDASSGYFVHWIIDVVHTRAGDLAQASSVANPDACLSERDYTKRPVVLEHCTSLSDVSWLHVHQIGTANAWTVDLYDGYLASAAPLTGSKAIRASWSPKQAFIVQFPPHTAHTE